MGRQTREWDHMSMSPASDATLVIDVPSDPSGHQRLVRGGAAISRDKKGCAVIESVSARSL